MKYIHTTTLHKESNTLLLSHSFGGLSPPKYVGDGP